MTYIYIYIYIYIFVNQIQTNAHTYAHIHTHTHTYIYIYIYIYIRHNCTGCVKAPLSMSTPFSMAIYSYWYSHACHSYNHCTLAHIALTHSLPKDNHHRLYSHHLHSNHSCTITALGHLQHPCNYFPCTYTIITFMVRLVNFIFRIVFCLSGFFGGVGSHSRILFKILPRLIDVSLNLVGHKAKTINTER